MNAAQLHLLLNHLPVIIPLVGAPILAIGIFIKSTDVQKVGLWLLVVSALAAAPAYLTGEPAEKFLKNYPGVSRITIHRHEDAAQLGLIGIEIVGAVSLLLLIASKFARRIPRYIWAFHLLLAATSLVLLMRASHLGGEIRHEEIQSEEALQSS